jgi:hypothetical protein
MKVMAHFRDAVARATWTEHGVLCRAQVGGVFSHFVLESDEGGNRVFPLNKRWVEVYVADCDDPVVVTREDEVVIDLLKEVKS